MFRRYHSPMLCLVKYMIRIISKEADGCHLLYGWIPFVVIRLLMGAIRWLIAVDYLLVDTIRL